jgi:hypothetical protein
MQGRVGQRRNDVQDFDPVWSRVGEQLLFAAPGTGRSM